MEFTKITPEMVAEIRGLAEEVIPGPEIHDDFCHDELAGIHCRQRCWCGPVRLKRFRV